MSLTVRVSGRAEFSHIKREVKDLDQNLKGLRNTVQRGFGQGFFTHEQTRTAQFLIEELKRGERDLNSILDEQRTKIDDIQRKWNNASGERRKALRTELDQRREILKTHENELDAIRKKRQTLERQMGDLDTRGSDSGGFGTLLDLGKKALGILGIGSVASYSRQALVSSAERHRSISDLGMRLGASNREDFEDFRRNIRDTGTPYGYTALESYQMVDTFTQRGGPITLDDQDAMQGFSRAFGLSANQVAQMFGEITRFGGSEVGQQRQFAEMMASAIDKGGMRERAVEAMETTAGLMGDLARNLPEVSTAGVLALQTLLNQTDTEAFRGERGADFLSSLNTMVQTGANDAGEAFVLRALGWGQDKSYYEAKLQAEQGIFDEQGENLPAVLGYLQKTVKNVELQDLILASLAGISLTMAKTFREKTNNYQDLSDLSRIRDEIESGMSSPIDAVSGQEGLEDPSLLDQKTDIWMESLGARILQVDAQLTESIASLGNGMTEDFVQMKEITGDMVATLSDVLGSDKTGGGEGILGDLFTATTALNTTIAGLTAYLTSRQFMNLFNKGGGGAIPTPVPGADSTTPSTSKSPIFPAWVEKVAPLLVGVARGGYSFYKERQDKETGLMADITTASGAGLGAWSGASLGLALGSALAPITGGLSVPVTLTLSAGGAWLLGNLGEKGSRKIGTEFEEQDAFTRWVAEQQWKDKEHSSLIFDNVTIDQWREWQELEAQGQGTVDELFASWKETRIAYENYRKEQLDKAGYAWWKPHTWGALRNLPSYEEFLAGEFDKDGADSTLEPTWILPTIEAPVIEIPEPVFELPTLEPVSLTIPEPEFAIPELEQLTLDIPEPEFTIPDLHQIKLDIPEPEFTIPELEQITLDIPEPEYKIPQLEPVEVNVPEPNFILPKMEPVEISVPEPKISLIGDFWQWITDGDTPPELPDFITGATPVPEYDGEDRTEPKNTIWGVITDWWKDRTPFKDTEQETKAIPEKAQKTTATATSTTALRSTDSSRKVIDMNVNVQVNGDELDSLSQETILTAFQEIAREVFSQIQQEDYLLNSTVRTHP